MSDQSRGKCPGEERTHVMTQKIANDPTELVTVVVTLKQVISPVVEARFQVTAPRKDADNKELLLEACNEQEQPQDLWGYYEPQAGEWRFQYEQKLRDLDIDVLASEVVYSEITGVAEDQDEDADEE